MVDAATTPFRPWTWREKAENFIKTAKEVITDPIGSFNRLNKQIINMSDEEYIAFITEGAISVTPIPTLPRIPRLPRRPRIKPPKRRSTPKQSGNCARKELCFAEGTLIHTTDGLKAKVSGKLLQSRKYLKSTMVKAGL